MGGQKEDFYRNFTRKDLRDLCKKYGLPANKSNSDMVSSLILCLERKSLNSRIWKATGRDSLSVETLEPRRRRISPSGDQQKDSRGTMSSSGPGNNQCNIQNGQHDLQNKKDPVTSDKASEDVRSSVQAPSHFQFDVSSEDGIQLFVDLNSTPSDWIKSLKDGVHICSDMHKLGLPDYLHGTGQRCCKHMKISSLVDSYKEVDNGDVADGSHPVTTGVGALPKGNELNGVEGSQGLLESSSNTFDEDRVRVCEGITCQPKSNGKEQCGLTNSVTFTKIQTFEVTSHTKSASSSGLLDGHSSDPTDVNQDKVEIENSQTSTSGEYDQQMLESQKHQVGNQINGHCTPRDSGDLDKDLQESWLTSMEISGRVFAGDQSKKSECLDFRDSITRTRRKSSGSESSRGRKRKLLVNGTRGQSQSVKPDAMITRITRQKIAGKIHDSRRRSLRRFTK